MSQNKIYCFRASYELSADFNKQAAPDWLCVEADWQGYKIITDPWVADVARILGALNIEDNPEEWISHLESLQLRGIIQISCEEMYESKGYS